MYKSKFLLQIALASLTATLATVLIVSASTTTIGNNISTDGTLGVTGLTTLVNASSTQLTTTGSTYLATTGGNVGIGTTTSQWLLQINGTRPSFALSDSSAGINLKHWLFSSMGGNLYIGTSSDAYGTSTPPVFTIANDGTVGIGTNNPGSRLLRLYKSQNTATTLMIDNPNTDSSASASLAFAENNTWRADIDWIPANKDLEIWNNVAENDADIKFYTRNASTPKIVFKGTGNVGIGTTSPNNLLDIYSTTKSAIGFSGASGDTYKWTIGMDKSDAGKFKIASSTALGTLDRLIIDGNGSLGIGGRATTTAAGVFSPGRYPTGSTPTCTSNEEGGFLWNSTTKKSCVCTGASWIEATSTSPTACF